MKWQWSQRDCLWGGNHAIKPALLFYWISLRLPSAVLSCLTGCWSLVLSKPSYSSWCQSVRITDNINLLVAQQSVPRYVRGSEAGDLCHLLSSFLPLTNLHYLIFTGHWKEKAVLDRGTVLNSTLLFSKTCQRAVSKPLENEGLLHVLLAPAAHCCCSMGRHPLLHCGTRLDRRQGGTWKNHGVFSPQRFSRKVWMWHWRLWLVDMGWWLDWTTLVVFSSLYDSMLACYPECVHLSCMPWNPFISQVLKL